MPDDYYKVYTVQLTVRKHSDRKSIEEMMEEFVRAENVERINDQKVVVTYATASTGPGHAFREAANLAEAVMGVSAVGPVSIEGATVVDAAGNTEAVF